ncbi:hypothetical protein HDK77DRAFT_72271 [Phyllosticta capitalensis]|uniref:Uncharacterized protein n=1 Tax=Phyllosticta capitalensis TaxID=121624 RepID=A0ABR1YRG6_9PEZI
MLIPTENVGSLPRPMHLQQTYAQYDHGLCSKDTLVKAQDAAVRDTIENLERSGQLYVSDGEQRASSFATYPVTDTLNGTGLSPNLIVDEHCFTLSFQDGHTRTLPRLLRGPFRYKTYAYDMLRASMRFATKPMKAAVIAPSMMYLLYVGEVPGYPKHLFVKDIINECVKDIRGCFASGAVRVSIDFTEGRFACQAGSPPNLIDVFVELLDAVVAHFTPRERRNIGLHTCPGGDCDTRHSDFQSYYLLLPKLLKVKVGYFLMQMKSEPNQERLFKLIGKHLPREVDGFRPVAFIGVINPLTPHVEKPEDVADLLIEASIYIPVDQLGATDDCGFSPFNNDLKPKSWSPNFGRDIAFRKIRTRMEGARLASEEFTYLRRRNLLARDSKRRKHREGAHSKTPPRERGGTSKTTPPRESSRKSKTPPMDGRSGMDGRGSKSRTPPRERSGKSRETPPRERSGKARATPPRYL